MYSQGLPALVVFFAIDLAMAAVDGPINRPPALR
jgi:hypothetical protein